MTPTATYIAEENCLQEISQMEKPEPPPNREKYGDHEFDYERDWFNYNGNLEIYNKHIASLRRISCSPECKELWADQQKVVENVDYQLKTVCVFAHQSCMVLDTCVEGCVLTAFPLVPVKSEDDDRWEEVEAFQFSVLGRSEEDAFIDILKGKYKIGRK